MNIEAAFVTSAAGPADFPVDRLPEIVLVGRSNVGKSSLINALVRRRIARTSAAPGKTRLANIYRVARGPAGPHYLVDLPGYGYARGGRDSTREFRDLTNAYFGGQDGPARQVAAVLLLIDARHPGLESDSAAWAWFRETVSEAALVATKIDKLGRGQRIRVLRELESVFEHPVVPVSAVTGEGLDELWNLIDRLVTNRNLNNRQSRNSSRRPLPQRGATAPRPRKS